MLSCGRVLVLSDLLSLYPGPSSEVCFCLYLTVKARLAAMNSWLVIFAAVLVWGRQGASQPHVPYTDTTPVPINPIPVTGQCTLQGFDLNTISSEDYWRFNLPHSYQWLVPVGLEKNISSVEVFAAFCKPLPADYCKANNQTTFCQRVTLKNGSSVDYDMGSFNKNNGFIPDTDTDNKDEIGFYIKEAGLVPVNSTTCKGVVSTIMNFQCSSFSRWTNKNITSHVILATHEFTDCLYQINVLYSGACYEAPTVSPGSCQLNGYDTATLARVPFWHATVPHTVCFNGTYDSTCKIAFSFCHAIPDDQDSTFNLKRCFAEVATVCQIGLTSDGDKSLEYSMGHFNSYTQFVENQNLGGFHMDVTNGSRPANGTLCPGGLNTRILLVCNPTVAWPANRNLTDLIHSTYDDHCQYTFRIQYNGACLSTFPVVDSPSPVGWILIGIFLLGVILYITVGMAYQYFAKGARGADIIPHYTFWSAVGSLVVGGCKFTLDIVTCFQLKKVIRVGKIAKSSNVPYDQI